MSENSTEDDSLDNYRIFLERSISDDPMWAKYLTGTILLITFCGSLIGNGLTCIVIYYDKTMHTATNYYLFNLAVSDLLTTFAVFLEIQEQFSPKFYDYNYYECKIYNFFVLATWNNGILVMTALAIERYIVVCYPMWRKSTPVLKRVGKIIILVWIIALLETLPELFIVNILETEFGTLCILIPSRVAKLITGVLAMLTFVFPLVIMIYVYIMIALKVNLNEKANTARVFNHKDNRSKVNKLVVALTLSFVVCWLPYFCVRIWIFRMDIQNPGLLTKWWNVLYRTTIVNSWFSSLVNPILFSMMSTKFRKALKAFWRLKFRRQVVGAPLTDSYRIN